MLRYPFFFFLLCIDFQLVFQILSFRILFRLYHFLQPYSHVQNLLRKLTWLHCLLNKLVILLLQNHLLLTLLQMLNMIFYLLIPMTIELLELLQIELFQLLHLLFVLLNNGQRSINKFMLLELFYSFRHGVRFFELPLLDAFLFVLCEYLDVVHYVCRVEIFILRDRRRFVN